MDAKGIDKAAILAALYNASQQQGLGFLDRRGSVPMTIEVANEVLNESAPDYYFDYLFGRVLKIDLSKDWLELRLYDRDNGYGAGEKALKEAGLI